MDQLWIEPVGNIIIARVRGIPNEQTLRECQERVVALVNETERSQILYDCLEMETPSIEVPLAQWKLDKLLSASIKLRRAVVVPNTKLAYLARIAFGEEDIRIFYSDMKAAINWLTTD